MMTESIAAADLPETYDALKTFTLQVLSELKIEKLGRARAELKAADLLQRLYGAKNERLNEDQRLLFGIQPPADPPLLKERARREEGGPNRIRPRRDRHL